MTYFSLRLDLHKIFEKKISNKTKNIYVMLVIEYLAMRPGDVFSQHLSIDRAGVGERRVQNNNSSRCKCPCRIGACRPRPRPALIAIAPTPPPRLSRGAPSRQLRITSPELRTAADRVVNDTSRNFILPLQHSSFSLQKAPFSTFTYKYLTLCQMIV